MKRIFPFFLLVTLLGCAHSPIDDPADPLEPINRKIYVFNNVVDKVALRPAAKVYVAVAPEPVRTGVNNFFVNLFYPDVIANDFFQLKLRQGAADAGRFLVNTTIGILGIFDVADHLFGLQRHDEDFGQTLGHYGVGEGWYLVLPLLGPSTNRDLVGRVGDIYIDPFNDYADDDVRVAALILSTVDKRSRYLGSDNLLDEVFDPYSFVRGAYLQRRYSEIYDGNPPPEKDDSPGS